MLHETIKDSPNELMLQGEQSQLTQIAELSEKLSEAIAQYRLNNYSLFQSLNEDITERNDLNLADLQGLLDYLMGL